MSATGRPGLAIFPTNFGWCGIAGSAQRVSDILIGHSNAEQVRQALAARYAERGMPVTFAEIECHPELRRRLERYALGHPVNFDDIELDLPPGTPFQRRVLAVTRRIPYGKTLSYGKVAAQAGYSRAARAVGTVMASNRFPILIPCHRVVAAAGKLGGYSAPQGPDLKARLLALEAEAAL